MSRLPRSLNIRAELERLLSEPWDGRLPRHSRIAPDLVTGGHAYHFDTPEDALRAAAYYSDDVADVVTGNERGNFVVLRGRGARATPLVFERTNLNAVPGETGEMVSVRHRLRSDMPGNGDVLNSLAPLGLLAGAAGGVQQLRDTRERAQRRRVRRQLRALLRGGPP